MNKTYLIVFSLLMLLLRCLVSSAQAMYNASIDLEPTQCGKSTIWGAPVGRGYSDWESIFSEIGSLYSLEGEPAFRDGYYGKGLAAGAYRLPYPPGTNSIGDLSEPVYSVGSDVGTAYSETVIMLMKDPNDKLIGGAASAPFVPASESRRTGIMRRASAAAKAEVEWRPNGVESTVQVDNVFSEAPEPAALLLLGLGGLMLRRRRHA